MEQLRQEAVVDALDGLYMSPAAKPGWTLFGSCFGRLMLTGERLMFLSTGANIGLELLFTAVSNTSRARVLRAAGWGAATWLSRPPARSVCRRYARS